MCNLSLASRQCRGRVAAGVILVGAASPGVAVAWEATVDTAVARAAVVVLQWCKDQGFRRCTFATIRVRVGG